MGCGGWGGGGGGGGGGGRGGVLVPFIVMHYIFYKYLTFLVENEAYLFAMCKNVLCYLNCTGGPISQHPELDRGLVMETA